MIRFLGKIPHRVLLAFSGGVDSLAVAHFLKNGHRDVVLLHFNHGCEHSDAIEAECRVKAAELHLPIIVGHIGNPTPPQGSSLEDYWRRCRYRFLKSHMWFPDDMLITCHHLDDAVETWVWSALHGDAKLLPYKSEIATRPFLITEKTEFVAYAERHGLEAVHDPYNEENHLIRNYIRSNLLPHAYYVNPGLKKVIKKKYLGKRDELE